jgi:hypothetical protein
MTRWCRDCEPGRLCRRHERIETGKPMLRIQRTREGVFWLAEVGRKGEREVVRLENGPLGDIIEALDMAGFLRTVQQ